MNPSLRKFARVRFLFFACFALAASGVRAKEPDFDVIDAFVHQRLRAMRIPGAALCIVQGDKIVHLATFGVADANRRSVTPQTPFALASVSKSFTGVAVMQLVEQGKIRLDDPVQKYLPWFRVADAEASRRITVRHLLNQTSGLPAAVGREGIADLRQDDHVIEENVRRTANVRLAHPVGQTYEYCNANFNAAGLVVSAASGVSYREYIETHLFAPLEMRHSHTTDAAARADQRSMGHRFWFGVPIATTFDVNRGMLPAGGLICSAEDMGHYLIAQANEGKYKNHALLSPAGIAATHAPAARISGKRFYGMGWIVSKRADGGTTLRHSGDGSDFHSNIVLLLDRKLGFALLLNANSAAWIAGDTNNEIAYGVTNLLLGQAPDAPRWNGYPLLIAFSVGVPLVIALTRLIRLLRLGRSPDEKRFAPRRLAWGFLGDALLLAYYFLVLPLAYQLPLPEVALFLPDAFLLICLGSACVVAGMIGRLWLLRAQTRTEIFRV